MQPIERMYIRSSRGNYMVINPRWSDTRPQARMGIPSVYGI